jgi:hypothetical protein
MRGEQDECVAGRKRVLRGRCGNSLGWGRVDGVGGVFEDDAEC